jgi:hypothetical protein
MGCTVKDLAPSGAVKFETASACLLPNEFTRFVCEIHEGFLVLTNRRIVLLGITNKTDYEIQLVLPFDCYHQITQIKPSHFRIEGIPLDENGQLEASGASIPIDIRPPKTNRKVRKTDVRDHFQRTMNLFHGVLEDLKETPQTGQDIPPPLDYSYLDNLPKSLTDNAMLDLNTILEDKPLHHELWHEAKKFLGDDPFLLEESLRAGNDPTNGVLLAAGDKGFIWIQGRKSGRFISSVLVDKLEWDNIKCFIHRWQTKKPIIETRYSLQKGMKEVAVEFTWELPINRDTVCYPWLIQKMNGPWILADIMYMYSGVPMRASCPKAINHEKLHPPRYYA